MSDNVIAHLRQNSPLSWKDRLEAADEITRLREENEQLMEQLAIRSESAMAKDMQEIMRINETLREENARLWDLLDNALGWLDDKEHDKPLMSLDSIRAARAAILEGGKDD